MSLLIPPDDPGAPAVRVIRVVSRERQADWLLAVFMLGWGAVLALPGDVFASSPAYAALAEKLTEVQCAAIMIGVGLARCVALVVNGHAPKGSPVLRCIAALAGAVIWSQLTYGFVAVSFRMELVTPGVVVGAVPLVFDLITARRAAADAVRARFANVAHR